jgi:hypothetical protein
LVSESGRGRWMMSRVGAESSADHECHDDDCP